MNAGYYDRNESLELFLERQRRYALIMKGTPEEQSKLKKLWIEASRLAGSDWCEYSNEETTDKGIEESAKLLGEFRILLANILHREETKWQSENQTKSSLEV